MTNPLFYLGTVTATAQVVSSLDEQTILAIVRRHAMGDWGDLCHEEIHRALMCPRVRY